MVERCCVEGCGSETNRGSSCKLYRFPRDENVLQQWKVKLNITNLKSTDRICNLHFNDSDYMLTNLGWKVLKQGAIPSVNLLSTSPVSKVVPSTDDGAVKQVSDTSGVSEVSKKAEPSDSSQERFYGGSKRKRQEFHETGLTLGSQKALIGRDNIPIHPHEGCIDDDVCAPEQIAHGILDASSSDKAARSDEENISVFKTQETYLSCSECDKKFPCRFTLLFHLSLHHKFVCHLCGKTYTSKLDYGLHVQNCGQKKKLSKQHAYTCNRCKQCFKLELDLSVHLVSCPFQEDLPYSDANTPDLEHSSSSFYCHLCGFIFCLRAELRSHLLAHNHKEVPSWPYTCRQCFELFNDEELLAFHVREKHLKKRLSLCEICHRVFFSQKQLEQHEEYHGSKHECPECCCVYTTRKKLISHLKLHQFVLLFFCEYCELMFGSVEIVEAHLMTHDLSVDMPVTCDLCSQSPGPNCLSETHYHVHQIVNASKDDKFKAGTYVPIGNNPSCNGILQKENDVTEPDTVWIDVEPVDDLDDVKNVPPVEISKILCQDCGRTFTNDEEFMIHQDSHKNRGDFSCIECGKPCHSSSALADHYEEHVKIEEECDFSSSYESY